RTELDEIYARRRSHLLPHRGGPCADQLAEHLAHFRRGDEIALRAERVARRVVAVLRVAKTKLHVAVDRNRAVDCNDAAELGFKRRHGLSGGRRSARAISTMPNNNSGNDSSMP